AMHDLISPGRTGWELAPASANPAAHAARLVRPVAVASTGPIPQPLWIRYSPSCQWKIVGPAADECKSFLQKFSPASSIHRRGTTSQVSEDFGSLHAILSPFLRFCGISHRGSFP